MCLSEVISLFRSLKAGSQVVALLMLCLCVIKHTLCDRVRACNCYVSYLLVYCVCLPQDDVCENDIGSVYGGGYCGLRKSGLCVFGKLCSVGFLVVCKCSYFFAVVCPL